MYTHPIFGEQHINKSSIDYICSQLYSQIGYSSEDECILDAKKLDNNRLFRIVRINGDGTIRIVADESVGLSQFNENDNLEEYVGYTYKTRIGYGINEKTNLESVRELDISSSYNSYYIYLTDSKFTFDNESKRYVFDGKYECIKASECLNEKAKCEGKYMVTTPQYNSYCSLIPPEKNYWLYKIKEIGKLSDNTMTIKTIDYRFGGSAIFDQNSKDNDSIMKQYLDQWYKDNLNSFDNLLANTRYCNDTTIRSSYPRNDFGFYYSVDFRLSTFSEHIPEPTYICPNTNLDYGGEYDLKILGKQFQKFNERFKNRSLICR